MATALAHQRLVRCDSTSPPRRYHGLPSGSAARDLSLPTTPSPASLTRLFFVPTGFLPARSAASPGIGNGQPHRPVLSLARSPKCSHGACPRDALVPRAPAAAPTGGPAWQRDAPLLSLRRWA
eukprot:scaffold1678_cov110-Isochrysis_galbana.AAC.10